MKTFSLLIGEPAGNGTCEDYEAEPQKQYAIFCPFSVHIPLIISMDFISAISPIATDVRNLKKKHFAFLAFLHPCPILLYCWFCADQPQGFIFRTSIQVYWTRKLFLPLTETSEKVDRKRNYGGKNLPTCGGIVPHFWWTLNHPSCDTWQKAWNWPDLLP